MGIFSRIGGTDPVLKIVNASADRKTEAEKRLQFFNDQQTDDLYSSIARKWKSPEDFTLFSVNIVRKIVKRLATVYKDSPVRTFDGADQATVEAIYAGAMANARLKQANRITKLCKSAALQVRWTGTGIALHVLPPSVLDVLGDDPLHPERIIVTHKSVTESETTYSDWTATSYTRRDYRGNPIIVPGNPKGVNPYGVLPFVPLFDRLPDDEFFLTGGDDIIAAQEAVNIELANLWRALEYATHGQLWTKGANADVGFNIGPQAVINLPAESDIGILTPATDVDGVLKAIEFVIKNVCVSNDLAANVFEIDAKAESAAAKNAERHDLTEAREDDIDLWRTYETRLFEVVKAVVNAHLPGAIPEAATVRVDFPEPSESLSESERLDAYQRRMDMGLWSAVDALLADNPDITDRAEAIRLLQERQEERAMFSPSFVN